MPPESASPALAVTGIGMMTPVGHDALQACASLRADMVMMQELEYFSVETEDFRRQPVIGCPVSGVTDGHVGLGRWTKLASRAVGDLIDRAELDPSHLSRTGLYIALPPRDRKGTDPRIHDMLGLRIAQWNKVQGLEGRTRAYPDGHAAAIQAVQEAAGDLAAGRIDCAIVGGTDSLVEPETLEFLVEKRRIKTDDNPDGFIPGEAAAFFTLETREKAEARGADVMAVLEGASVAREPATVWADEPSAAAGLGEAITGTLEGLDDNGAKTGLVICDLNGESYRAKEFGTVVPRVLSRFQTEWQVWHPADCIGDTGSASAAISACMAARALQRGYARTDNVLVWGASDDGLRGSMYLRKPG